MTATTYTFSAEYADGGYEYRVCGDDGCCIFYTMASINACIGNKLNGAYDAVALGLGKDIVKIEISIHTGPRPASPELVQEWQDMDGYHSPEWGEGLYNH
mgnify:CR=1 FL=1|tara:strand:+ start:3910 stop:4209 length:300 start_codon:yes stop_codon:yes gene_type:complete